MKIDRDLLWRIGAGLCFVWGFVRFVIPGGILIFTSNLRTSEGRSEAGAGLTLVCIGIFLPWLIVAADYWLNDRQ
ncbi:MAG: hypothetical protein JSS72_08735 [Armatimonadetes bacterium]|nr:hypothetical protein [Armatimonadota bacterium]